MNEILVGPELDTIRRPLLEEVNIKDRINRKVNSDLPLF